MAQRLATLYVKTCLLLSEAQMPHFVAMFQNNHVRSNVKVLDNGRQEVVFADAEEEISLTFDRIAGAFICKGTCSIRSPKLTNLMRQAVSAFKGDAIVHRQYTGYTLIYHYEQGTVVRIIECQNSQEKLVFEYKDTIGRLTNLFQNNKVEEEIHRVRGQVNQLLDLRNESSEDSLQKIIDERLSRLTHELIVLEA